jgi:hypothetical protein
LGYVPVNKAGDTMTGNLTVRSFTQAGQFSAGSGASITADYNVGQSQFFTMSGNTTVNIVNVPTGSILRLVIVATNAGTVTWAGSPAIWWPGGVAPNLATGPQKYALVVVQNIGGAQLGNVSAY